MIFTERLPSPKSGNQEACGKLNLFTRGRNEITRDGGTTWSTRAEYHYVVEETQYLL